MAVLMAALFTVAQRCKTPTSLLVEGWISKQGEHIGAFLCPLEEGSWVKELLVVGKAA